MTTATNPNHYSRWAIEPIEFIRKNKLDFARANIIKYIMRYDAKDGIKDLDKALQYLEWLREDWLNRPTGITPLETPLVKKLYRMEKSYPVTPVDNDLIAAERALYDQNIRGVFGEAVATPF